MSNKWVTRKTLLGRIKKQGDDRTWKEFVSYYETFIHMVLIRFGVNAEVSDDLQQEILLSLWKNLKNYDPKRARFRTWLSTIIRNQVNNHHRKQVSRDKKHLAFIMDKEDFSNSSFEDMVEEEWKTYITNLALHNIADKFSGKAVEVFSLSMKGLKAGEIAKKVDVEELSIYSLRSRVKTKMIEEIQCLRRDLEGE